MASSSSYLKTNDWSCPKCTFKNPKSSNECSMCNYNKGDTNSYLSPTKLIGTLKNAITSLNNDLKSFDLIPKSKYPDVIIIDDPRLQLPTPPPLPSQTQNENTTLLKWNCQRCTYGGNIETSDECSICSSRRGTRANVQSNNNNEQNCKTCGNKITNNASSCQVCGVIIPNNRRSRNDKNNNIKKKTAENEPDIKITDIVKTKDNWICSKCTFSNSKTDKSCAICHTNSINDFPPKSSQTASLHSQRAKSMKTTYEKATNNAEIIWKNIVLYCKVNKHKFIDDSFPPCDKSLFIDVNNKTKCFNSRQSKWLSPADIYTGNDRNKWSVYNEPTFSDIKQGNLVN
jgi:hypothetical protein